MDQNVGTADRYARIAAGTALVGAGAASPEPVGTAAGLAAGGVALATGVTGYCPAYDGLGVDTTSG